MQSISLSALQFHDRTMEGSIMYLPQITGLEVLLQLTIS